MDEQGKHLIIEGNDTGSVKISDDVVKIIAGMAAMEIKGVSAMSGGIADGIVEKLGRKNLSRGVKAEVGEKEAAIEISVIIEYGKPIREVASRIQARVKEAVESMTGLKVVEVNVNVQGVSFVAEAQE
ncbi:MAG: Asp23/Gls24 family envelope stress response protein [Peptococcaceae bacterium]|nr:Asp23/Gls24 family envelope stress response protein [Peptococcaceae bacterium]